MATFSSQTQQALRDRLEGLIKDYQVVQQQLRSVLDPVEERRLKSLADDLEREIREIEDKLFDPPGGGGAKRRMLEKRWADLLEEYAALNRQLKHELSHVNRIRIERYIANLEADLQAIELELSRSKDSSVSSPKLRHDVFISYSLDDATWVKTWLIPRLHKADLKVADYTDVMPGQQWSEALPQLLETSSTVLLILTPAYVFKEWPLIEEFASLSGSIHKIVPILLEKVIVPPAISDIAYADFTQVDARELQSARLILSLQNKKRSATDFPTFQYDIRAITDVLRTYFDTDELMTLCFELGIHSDDLAGYGSKTRMSFELVDYLRRRDRLDDLLYLLEQERPFLKMTEQDRTFLVRAEPIRSFFEKAGFKLSPVTNPADLLAVPTAHHWLSRFSKGLYIRMLFDSSLNQAAVNTIYQDAKSLTNHALVIVNKPPTASAWMSIGSFRVDDDEQFCLLPVDEVLVKEALAIGKESRTLRLYIDKHLGKGFNPYDVRDPVSDAISFFGREGLADELASMLRLGRRIGLFGVHKIGKSSVMQRLRNKLEFPVAYVYLRKNDTLTGIYRRIVDAWSLDARIKYRDLNLEPAFSGDSAITQADFETLVEAYLEKLGTITDSPQLGVFLDEIEAIIPYQKGDEATLHLYVTLMDSLRGLQHETGQLALLVAGIYPSLGRVNYFWGEQKNPMHQVITERFLPSMSAEDCEIMIRSLGEQIRVNYDQETVNYIFHASGGHPFLARQLCSLAVERHNDAGRIPFSLIEQVTTDFVRNPATASYFDDQGLWGELGKAVIWGESVSQAHHHVLRQLAANHPTGLMPDELQAAAAHLPIEGSLYALNERHVIKTHPETGRYVITFGLFADWIRRNK